MYTYMYTHFYVYVVPPNVSVMVHTHTCTCMCTRAHTHTHTLSDHMYILSLLHKPHTCNVISEQQGRPPKVCTVLVIL